MGIRLNVDADAGPFNRGMGLAQGAMAGFAATITNVALRAIGSLRDGIGEFVTDTSKVNAITTSFENMSGALGLSADEMLNKLGPATRGLVSDFDLMEISNNAMALGIVQSTDQWAEWGRIATAAGRAVGRDTTSALGDISTGLGRMSPLILDNLGITIDMARETKIWAEENDRLAASITEAEKKQLFMNAALVAGRKIAADAGDSSFVLGDMVTKLGVAWKNFRLRLITTINESPAVQTALQAITDLLSGENGMSGALDSIIEQFQALLPGAMIIAVRGIQGMIGALALLHRAYIQVQRAANAYGVIVSSVVVKALEIQRGIVANNIERLEGLGRATDGVTEAIERDLAALAEIDLNLAQATGTLSAFSDQFDDAADRGDAFAEIINNMQAALDDAVVSIRSAGTEATTMGAAMSAAGNDGVTILTNKAKDLSLIIGAVPFPAMTNEVIDAGVWAGELTTTWGELITQFRTGNTILDSVLRMFGKLITSMGSFTTSANTASAASGGFFSSLTGGGSGILGFLGGPLGGLLMGGIAAAIPFIAKLFGGPDDNELSARRIKESVESMLGPLASIEEQSEATTAGVRVSGIVVRDAYLAMGFSLGEAEAAMASLANLSKQQPAEAQASADAIMKVVDAAAEAMRETGKDLTTLRNDNINAANRAAEDATEALGDELDDQVEDAEQAYQATQDLYADMLAAMADEAETFGEIWGEELDEMFRKTTEFNRAMVGESEWVDLIDGMNTHTGRLSPAWEEQLQMMLAGTESASDRMQKIAAILAHGVGSELERVRLDILMDTIAEDLENAFASRPVKIPITATLSHSDISELGRRVQRDLRRDILEAHA